MDRVVYSPTATDILVWRTGESDIIVWDIEHPEDVPSFSRIERTVYIAARTECCGPF